MREEDLLRAAQAGEARASRALSAWLHRPVRWSVSRVARVPFAEVADLVGGDAAGLVAALVRVKGEVEGSLVLAFTEEDAGRLVRRLVPGAGAPSFEAWTDLERSAFEETGNVIGSAFVGAAAESLGLAMAPTAPASAHDFAVALLDGILLEVAAEGGADEAFVFDAAVSDAAGGSGLEACRILFIPARRAFEAS